jgi:hypothetical protein
LLDGKNEGLIKIAPQGMGVEQNCCAALRS